MAEAGFGCTYGDYARTLTGRLILVRTGLVAKRAAAEWDLACRPYYAREVMGCCVFYAIA